MAYLEAEYYLRDLDDYNEVLEVARIANTQEAAQDLLDLEAMPRGRDANSAVLLARVLRCYVGRDATLEEVVGPGARERGLRSLLHVAATEGHAGIARLLLEWGADPSDGDELQRSALHMAAARGHREVALLLLEHGAEAGARHCSGKTALHFAAEGSDDEELVRSLLDRGLGVNDADRIHRNTPLHLAAWNGKPRVARLLLERGASLRARNAQGCTPLHLGVRTKQLLELFLERGADLRCSDARGLTPLRWLDNHRIAEGKMIISRLVKDEALLGIPIDKENARCMQCQPIWRRIRDECFHEIATMKNAKCYREMTCFNLLSLSVTELAARMKNRRLSYALANLNLEGYFINYSRELRNKIVKAHEAKAHAHRVSHLIHRSLGDCLPHAVTEKIGEYLTAKDVKFR